MDDDVAMAPNLNSIHLPLDIHTKLDNELHFLLGLDFDSRTALILSIVINKCADAYATMK